MNELDKIMSTGAKSAFSRYAQPGDSVSGTILSATQRQVLDFTTKKPAFWDDGSPKMQIVISIQTGLREDAEDDGARSLYIKAWGKDKIALASAIRDAGFDMASSALATGNHFTATFTGTEPSGAGNDRKVYVYQVRAGSPMAGVDAAIHQAPATTQQAAQPQPQQAHPQPQQAFDQPPTQQQAQPQPQQSTPDLQTLIRQGLTDQQIAATLGLDTTVVAAIRTQLTPQ